MYIRLFLLLALVSGSLSSSLQRDGMPKFPLPGVLPDPWVALSPLIVGVVCKDGALLLALHTAFAEDNDESFLLHSDHPQSDARDMDLPRSYRGPFRIFPVDTAKTIALTCTGWRTDGQYLAELLKSMCRTENQMFGLPSSEANAEYGSFLACQASQRMAEFCFGGSGMRPLSTVGLLATSNALWMVDATGAYRVRACAIGAGSLSGRVNEYLQEKDWTTRLCKDVAKDLLGVLNGNQDNSDAVGHSSQDDHHAKDQTRWRVPEGSVVEMMAVERGPSKSTSQCRRMSCHENIAL